MKITAPDASYVNWEEETVKVRVRAEEDADEAPETGEEIPTVEAVQL